MILFYETEETNIATSVILSLCRGTLILFSFEYIDMTKKLCTLQIGPL